ncbi:aminotransferase class I/II-fold pyridoxal phosphate-dependent enzyme [candidate division GN15 bacterium]|nr:aminotransferase class I/II-fold pyridoxal phosphate-dependent enzyme [candidate division GN15 bacterium]
MDEHIKKTRFETRAIHGPKVPEDGTRSVTTPIYPSSTYGVEYPGDESGYVYARWSNPTRKALEQTLASLENGSHAYAFSSGLAALNAVLTLLKSGDHIVAVDDLYGGSMRQFEKVARNFGLDFTYVDGRQPDNFENAIKENTRLFWVETPTNPLLHLVDIEKVSAIAKEHNILLGVDNTFATPFIQQPLTLGADIVLHSASKYLGGHCDIIAGALVVNDPTLAEKLYFAQYAVGAHLNPFESWLMLRGIKTLHLRMERHSVNSMKIVEFLETVDLVDKIYYPGQDGNKVPNEMIMPGGMVTFSLKADFDAVKQFCMATKVFVLAESLGGVESLINHPASMTHASIPKEEREARGITDGLVRLSVGVEHIDDLLIDLRNALTALRKHLEVAAS